MIKNECYGKDLLLKELKGSFDFFKNERNNNPNSPGYGLVRDKSYIANEISSIASVGFGLASLVIGVEYDLISYEEAKGIADGTLNTFLNNLEDTNGFYYHFINMENGRREWNSEVSIIDTGLFICGAITAGQFFGNEVEETANKLYDRINWQWYTDEKRNMFHMGYNPERGFSGHWDYYAEQLMLYILGVASPTYPIDRSLYSTFIKAKGDYNDIKGIIHSWFGSLFTYQYSHAFIDFKDTTDKNSVNWWENSVKATLANRQYCIDNMDRFKTFGKNSWGLSACVCPKGYSGEYGAMPANHDIEHSNDGTVAIYSATGSIPFTPNESLKALENYYNNFPELWGEYGLKGSYNLEGRNPWASREYLGIDKGISLVMIANYMSDAIWNQFMKNEYVQKGMNIIGIEKIKKM